MKKAVILLAFLLFSATFCLADDFSSHSTSARTSFPATSTSPEVVYAWPRAACLVHAGLVDIGLGAKIRFSQENGIYMIADLRYQIFRFEYIRIPALFYLGGNIFHFVAGFTILNAVNAFAEDVSGEISLGINFDINEDWGIDLLAFTPVGGKTGTSLLLDIRYVF